MLCFSGLLTTSSLVTTFSTYYLMSGDFGKAAAYKPDHQNVIKTMLFVLTIVVKIAT